MTIACYIHIPFCRKKCPYCHFYKEITNATLIDQFIDAIKKEIAFYSHRFGVLKLKTIFLGGGTPNTLPQAALKEIFSALQHCFDLSELQEVTMEVNPGIYSRNKFEGYRKLGINRISLGVQSFIKEELQFLGRLHTVEDSHHTIRLLKDCGFDNINLDYIFGLPTSSLETVNYNINAYLSHKPTHISTYSLTIEPGTVFKKNHIVPASSDLERKQYMLIRKHLQKQGYPQYEVSNFSRPGFSCKHNVAYWTYKDYIGLGPSATSFFKGARYRHTRNLTHYIQDPTPCVFKNKTFPKLPAATALTDYILFHLRLLSGISIRDINSKFNISVEDKFSDALSQLRALKLIKSSKTRIQVTTKGLLLLDDVCEFFLN